MGIIYREMILFYYKYDKPDLLKRLGLILILCFLLAGCDIFRTRDAEQPTQPKSDFQPAISVNDLLDNFISSLKDKNIGNYLTCLSDTSFTDKKFYFSPSSEASLTYPLLTENWNRRNEEQYFTNMVIKSSSNTQIQLELIEISRNLLGNGDSTIYTASYKLQIPFVNTNSEIIQQIYEGILTFKMVRDSRSVWSIYYWQDNKTPAAEKSWSDLKGSLAN